MLRVLMLLILVIQPGCSKDDPGGTNPTPPENDYLEITLKPSETFQSIRYFGASDAWSCQFIGKNWPVQKREQIADWLFSREFDPNGDPKGIGLNSWRFNLGGGSAYQGGSSGISDEWRRADCFLTESGYNWNAQEGQRWFMEAAQLRGVSHFTAFVNSPPVTLTKNGKAHSSGGSSANLNPENYSAFASFIAETLTQLNALYGLEFAEISPFNEPQWDWTGGQEGSPWENSEIAAFSRMLDAEFQGRSIATKIDLAEAGKLNYLYEDADKEGRASQIREFLSPESPNYIGDLNSLSEHISGHSYYTTSGNSTLIDTRMAVEREFRNVAPQTEFWMSEYCLLENNGEIQGNGRDLSIDPALYMAKVIHTDLTVANASTWQWWLGVSPYDYKDGLVYTDYNKNDGAITDSKMLWALGNYSRFIQNGAVRIGVKRSDNQTIAQAIDGILISSFKNPAGSGIVTVLVNQRTISIPIKLKVDGLSSYTAERYQTSEVSDDDLAFKGTFKEGDLLEVPPRSIVTLVTK